MLTARSCSSQNAPGDMGSSDNMPTNDVFKDSNEPSRLNYQIPMMLRVKNAVHAKPCL